jgi:hypothetical protein
MISSCLELYTHRNYVCECNSTNLQQTQRGCGTELKYRKTNDIKAYGIVKEHVAQIWRKNSRTHQTGGGTRKADEHSGTTNSRNGDCPSQTEQRSRRPQCWLSHSSTWWNSSPAPLHTLWSFTNLSAALKLSTTQNREYLQTLGNPVSSRLSTPTPPWSAHDI